MIRLFYVAGKVSQNYLCSCLRALSVVDQDFPRISAATSGTPRSLVLATKAFGKRPYKINVAAYAPPQLAPTTPSTTPSCSGESPCSCPARTTGPRTKVGHPYPATDENIPKLKAFLIHQFKSSAFNVCETQPLPMMMGSPPLQPHVPLTTKPVACHTPAMIPLHWMTRSRPASTET